MGTVTLDSGFLGREQLAVLARRSPLVHNCSATSLPLSPAVAPPLSPTAHVFAVSIRHGCCHALAGDQLQFGRSRIAPDYEVFVTRTQTCHPHLSVFQIIMTAVRSISSSLLLKAVATASAASDSTTITIRSGHVHFGARVSFESSCSRIGRSATILGGLHRPDFARRSLSGSPPPLPVPGMERRYAVAQPYPEGLEMEVNDECGSEEVIEGCRVRHSELWNGDVRIHYVECGDKNGELVVLIHGFPNFWYVWKNQFHALAEAGYHVVAPDLRGYNTSSKPEGIQAYGRLSVVSDIVRLIDELGDGKSATVVGHDWGGFVTWAVAEDFPEKVKKAVIANVPHFSVFSAAIRSSFRQVRRSWYVGLFQLPWLPEWCMTGRGFKTLRAFYSYASFQPLDIDRHVRAYQKVGAAKGAINYYRAAVRGYWSPARTLVSLDLPVDLIWGELDAFLGKELAVIPNTIASKVVIKILPHCSHWPMWDDPKQFNAHLLESVSSQHATSADQVHNSNVVAANQGLLKDDELVSCKDRQPQTLEQVRQTLSSAQELLRNGSL